MAPIWIATLAAAGLAAGVLGGLLGIGGGSLMVPILIFALLARGIEPETAGLIAVATSLLPIVFLSGRAVLSHRAHRAGSWRAIALMGPLGVAGALAGAEAAMALGGRGLIWAFAGLEIILGIRFLAAPTRSEALPAAGTALAPPWRWGLIGLASGTVSSFFGVGGGIVAVPMQLWLTAVPIHTAIANSSGLIVFNALFGAGRYALAPTTTAVPHAIGLVDVPAGLLLALGALIGAPLGVRLAHGLDAARLRRIFGGFLVLIGVVLLLKAG